jgi:hypothetical protein
LEQSLGDRWIARILAFLAFFNYFLYSVDTLLWTGSTGGTGWMFATDQHRLRLGSGCWERLRLRSGSQSRGKATVLLMASIMAQGTEFARVMAATFFVMQKGCQYWRKRVEGLELSSMFF